MTEGGFVKITIDECEQACRLVCQQASKQKKSGKNFDFEEKKSTLL
jgi:hypothetical protein